MSKKDMNGMTLAEEIELLNEEFDSLSLEAQIASVGCRVCPYCEDDDTSIGICHYKESRYCPYGMGLIW